MAYTNGEAQFGSGSNQAICSGRHVQFGPRARVLGPPSRQCWSSILSKQGKQLVEHVIDEQYFFNFPFFP